MPSFQAWNGHSVRHRNIQSHLAKDGLCGKWWCLAEYCSAQLDHVSTSAKYDEKSIIFPGEGKVGVLDMGECQVCWVALCMQDA